MFSRLRKASVAFSFLLFAIAMIFAVTLEIRTASAKSGGRQPTSWTFFTVDDPGRTNTILTGTNEFDQVTGYAYSGDIRGDLDAFASPGPPFTKFYKMNYPGATHSVLGAVGSGNLKVGHYQTAQGMLAYIVHGNSFTSVGYPNTEFFGTGKILCVDPINGFKCKNPQLNGDPLDVGYSDSNGVVTAIEYDQVTKKTIAFNPPGAVSAMATEVTHKGDVVGSMVTASGLHESWLWVFPGDNTAGKYYEFAYPGAVKTTALSANWQRDVVGAYLDTSGRRHGFYYTDPAGKSPTWQSIDAPNAVGDTVVYSVNARPDIVGDYQGSDHRTHGFFAEPNPCVRKCVPSPSPSP